MGKLLTVLLVALAGASAFPLEAQSTPASQSSTPVSRLNALRVLSTTPAGQRFYCVGHYTAADCQKQARLLKAALEKYGAERLGQWSWIVVRTDDWKPLTSRLHLDPSSPAFSHLEYRQTFLDEALLVLQPQRQLELSAKWNRSFGNLLDYALSHELGHALCQESDEVKAEQFGQLLRKIPASTCHPSRQPTLFATSR